MSWDQSWDQIPHKYSPGPRGCCTYCGLGTLAAVHVEGELQGPPETVNHPSHYGGDTTYEAIKVIEAWKLGFCLGNTVKYICRAGKKATAGSTVLPSETLQDLKKAAWYLQREIKRLESAN